MAMKAATAIAHGWAHGGWRTVEPQNKKIRRIDS